MHSFLERGQRGQDRILSWCAQILSQSVPDFVLVWPGFVLVCHAQIAGNIANRFGLFQWSSAEKQVWLADRFSRNLTRFNVLAREPDGNKIRFGGRRSRGVRSGGSGGRSVGRFAGVDCCSTRHGIYACFFDGFLQKNEFRPRQHQLCDLLLPVAITDYIRDHPEDVLPVPIAVVHSESESPGGRAHRHRPYRWR